MTGETDLDALIASMQPVLREGVYVFASMAPESVPDGLDPVMQFVEAEGVTLILREDEARAHGVDAIYPCRMITLNIHSSLEAVGFLAAITAALQDKAISVNAVSAFYHDHLFVPEDRAEDAMAALQGLVASRT